MTIPKSMCSCIYYELSCIFYASFDISAPNHVKNLIPRGTFTDEELYFYAVHVQDKFTSMQEFIYNCQAVSMQKYNLKGLGEQMVRIPPREALDQYRTLSDSA